MKQDNSQQLFEIAKTLMPGGVNSPVRAFRSVGGTPVFIKRGKGAYITDEDDNQYIDFCCSWGPLILGHNHPKQKALCYWDLTMFLNDWLNYYLLGSKNLKIFHNSLVHSGWNRRNHHPKVGRQFCGFDHTEDYLKTHLR